MARSPSQMAETLGGLGRLTELRQRLLFVFMALIIYRIGTFIPVPGIDSEALAQFFQDQSGTILSMFNMFSGGALQRLSIFALGIMPYISASIIMQMAVVVVPQIAQLKKEGEAGRKKINQYTRFGTVILAAVQGYTLCRAGVPPCVARVNASIYYYMDKSLQYYRVLADCIHVNDDLELGRPSPCRTTVEISDCV